MCRQDRWRLRTRPRRAQFRGPKQQPTAYALCAALVGRAVNRRPTSEGHSSQNLMRYLSNYMQDRR
jgi:hypothetical protein